MGQRRPWNGAADYHDYFEIEVGRVAAAAALAPDVLRPRSGNGALHHERDELSGPPDDDLTLEGPRCSRRRSAPAIDQVRVHHADRAEPAATCSNSRSTSRYHPWTTTTDQPNEFTAEASEEHEPDANDSSQVKSATFILPAGMTLNPSAAHGLEACKPSQANEIAGTEKFTEAFGVGVSGRLENRHGRRSNVPTLPTAR